LEEARQNKLKLEFNETTIHRPNHLGTFEIAEMDLAVLAKYIDWTPFFQTWELHGKFPRILTDEVVGTEASKLYADAQAMLKKIIAEKWITAKAVYGLFPANSVGDDIQIYSDESCTHILHTQHTLRQQTKKAAGQPNIALSDFIASKESGIVDYVGGFVVTAGHGVDDRVKQFEADHDDYNAIMIKALADRFAEAFAEYLHEKVRKEEWGYGATEVLSNDQLIDESYRGIRPAPGYPACPDHTEKPGLFELLNATEISGVSLTETLAMWPAASVSGWYFGHPEAKYFGLGKISVEQVEDIARRKVVKKEIMERWLSSVLNY
jgi:5-methyltetrahydrofolate--homocysteine methyltransferase